MAPAPRARQDRTTAREGGSGRGRVTIHDVAQAAGVSIGTVSRALNDRAGVNPETRRRVLGVAAELAYDPDRAARELSNRRAVTVALSVAHGYRRLTPFFVLFLQRFNEHLANSGLRVFEVASGDDGLPERDADAFVLHGAHPDDPRIAHLARLGRPFVLVGHHPGVRCVAPDDVAGGRLAAEHLVRLGHRELLHLSGTPHAQAFSDRARGFEHALAAAGHGPSTTVVADDITALSAYRALRAHVEAGARPSAVFAATDELAIGCLAATADLGLRVPRDLSIVGFDDMPEVGSALTTIRQDIDALANETVVLLHEALQGEPVRTVRLPVTLVSRGTTAERR